MLRTAGKKKPKLLYATMQVTRVEHWLIEADTVEMAEALLLSGEGHRHSVGECLQREVHKIEE